MRVLPMADISKGIFCDDDADDFKGAGKRKASSDVTSGKKRHVDSETDDADKLPFDAVTDGEVFVMDECKFYFSVTHGFNNSLHN
jgi:hypothetical protein